jgi:molecular chaperone GrpE
LAENTEELESQFDEDAELVEADLQAIQEQILTLTTERDQLKQQVVQTMADFQNFKKRTEQENQMKRRFATEDFVIALLPVLDNFERTIKHAESGASLETLMPGVKAVEKQLRQALESQNVKKIVAVGQPFDPEEHEAIGMEPAEGFEANTVFLEVEPGYRMAEKVIRPARVKVAAG